MTPGRVEAESRFDFKKHFRVLLNKKANKIERQISHAEILIKLEKLCVPL